jgi:ADP-ribose pyrophosphatase YjhB (NUDIX family)
VHYIQRNILKLLLFQKDARYRDILPPKVSSNHFMYHLHCLLKEGYVEKQANYYHLTPKGKAYADRLSLKDLQPRVQPKIVTFILIEKGQQQLLYQRHHQPLINLIGFPYGKVHMGEQILEAAQRELAEKSHLKAKLKHRGDAYLRIYEGENLVSHMLCHIFSGKYRSGSIHSDSQKGKCFWGRADELEASQTMPGFLDIYKELKKDQPSFFLELKYKT